MLPLHTKKNSLSADVKTTLWQFVRNDIPTEDFELWVYSKATLAESMSDDIYLTFLMTNYQNKNEIHSLKSLTYHFLNQFPESCLCLTFPNNTRVYSFEEKRTGVVLKENIDLLASVMRIESFSGIPPIHESRWYQPGELSRYIKCKTWWFVIFEESERPDHYLVRLSEEDVSRILEFPDWPNEQWPSSLKSWQAFLQLNFKNWSSLYCRNNSVENPAGFLKNYDLKIDYK